MRKPKLDWDLYKDQLVELKYGQGKSLTAINRILFDKLGFCFSNARLSQKFSEWAKQQQESNANESNGVYTGGV